ncbi:integrase [Saccharobesus litoralis]|uniref:Integrase n=1 Tax=Saccharobesus litoralis TaxID=2172099 RepID=A0A2S0VPY9_9ALTE|nr:integrase core domain-containing protein [Saccharobesus litoralis]AWB66269.1 integrase [Saccharobesus litoralis]
MFKGRWLRYLALIWKVLFKQIKDVWFPKTHHRRTATLTHNKLKEVILPYPKNQKKPQWVIDKVIYLKAHLPNVGCGTIALTFNRLYQHQGHTVSKTFVYEKLKANQYAVAVKRRNIKHRKPKPVAVNQTWGMDLTFVTLNKKQHLVLGIIDHGSRALLKLQNINNKSALTLLRTLVQIFKQFGVPKAIRTDNEACFTAKFLKKAYWLLGIKPQTTNIASPWQNGRIERCFGSFKQLWRQVDFTPCCNLQTELLRYQIWYNHIRPHSQLNGQTPMETFTNKPHNHKNQPVWVSDWDGVLSGFYFPD